MTNNFLFEIVPLIALCLLMVLAIVVGAFWRGHYSRSAKALNKRLSDIVNMRSSIDEQLIKSTASDDYRVFETIAFTTKLNEMLKLMILRAGLTITSIRLLIIALGFVVAGFILLYLLTKLALLLLVSFSLMIGAVPFLYIKYLENKRTEKIEKQLPEALDFVCRSLRAGHGLAVSFGMVGDELPQPIAKEFKTVFEEINFGLPFNEAMSNFAMRTNSGDINFLVVGLVIQREAGGNLIELLENLSKTIRDRMILKGKVRVLASEGKYSGILLSALPFLLGGVLSFLNPNYMNLLWTSESGQHLVFLSVLMIVLGGLWMWNITRIKV